MKKGEEDWLKRRKVLLIYIRHDGRRPSGESHYADYLGSHGMELIIPLLLLLLLLLLPPSRSRIMQPSLLHQGEWESTATNRPIRGSLYGAISQLPGLFLQLAPDLRQIAARDSICNQPRLSGGGCLEGTEVCYLVGGRGSFMSVRSRLPGNVGRIVRNSSSPGLRRERMWLRGGRGGCVARMGVFGGRGDVDLVEEGRLVKLGG
ncbi:hypothetical protein E2C01_078377 [Portunus trituberculatus]|uniref:Uncharacterized protein n=1 Tax=Portunus trituberculatus TaxID=210409 RepID=A0A5B7IIK4_PORTR|nr:hypothetical protein [Portunus trituberculatus]